MFTLTTQLHAGAPVSSSSAVVADHRAGNGTRQQQAYSFPRWPEQQKQKREIVPPPPPGPYMSSAMMGSTAATPSFERHNGGARPPVKHEGSDVPANAPVAKFDPDVSWPSNSEKSPGRWKPESGYSYVETPVESKPYNTAAPGNYYGYRYPVMNRPGYYPGSMMYTGPRMNVPGYQPR